MNKLVQIFKFKVAILLLLSLGCADVGSIQSPSNSAGDVKPETTPVVLNQVTQGTDADKDIEVESGDPVCPTANDTSVDHGATLYDAEFIFNKNTVITKKLNCKSEVTSLVEEVSTSPNFEYDLFAGSGLKKIGLVVVNNRTNCSKVKVYNKNFFKSDNIMVGVIPAENTILLNPGKNFMDYIVYGKDCTMDMYTQDPKSCDDKVLNYGTLRIKATVVENVREKVIHEKSCP